MAKTSKSTRKFQNKHLKHTLDHRRDVQKENKKYSLRRGNKKSSEPAEPHVKQSAKPIFDDMSVDQFFEGGFEVPKPKKGSKVEENESESDMDEDEEDDDDEDEDVSGDEDEEEQEAAEGEELEADIDQDVSSSEEDDEMMEQDMKALEEKDPEFFKYLNKNDKGLLDFEAVNPLDLVEEGSDAETAQPTKKSLEVTQKVVDMWEKQLENEPTLKLVKEVIQAFKQSVDNAGDDGSSFKLSDASVFTRLMFVGLRSVPAAVQKLCPYKTNAKQQRSVNEKHANAGKLSVILKQQADVYTTLLRDLNNTGTAALVLASVLEVFPYLASQKRAPKQIIRAVAEVWATSTETDTQVATFAFLNNVAREFHTMLELVLRESYSSLVKNCRNTNAHTIESVNFAKNSAVELFGIDEQVSYTIGFEYVRQLAIHLRNTINSTGNGPNAATNSGKDAYKSIYNWQFCHSLDFWSRVLAQHCNPEKELLSHKSHESPLRSLIYPLVQVTLGVIRLIPTAQFFPLRFYLVRALIRLSQGTGVFIPIFPLLSEILTSTAFTKPPKNSPLPALDFDLIVKVGQQYLGTRVYQEGLQSQFIELTSEYLVLYCKNIAFPELVTPVVLTLRRYAKKSKSPKFNKQIQQLVEKLNANAALITSKRSNVDYGPSNKAEVQAFLKDEDWETTPLGRYVSVNRKVRETQAQLLKQAIADEQEAEKKRKSKKSLEEAEYE